MFLKTITRISFVVLTAFCFNPFSGARSEIQRQLSTSFSLAELERGSLVTPKPDGVLISRLREIFFEEGVPPYWVWIAQIESSWNPEAVSSKGATGLFQIMSETARRFGLEVVDGVDERLDPEKSARAAAKYLKILYEQFGSWPLALAAYNAGEGCVSRLLEKHEAHGFKEIAFDLPLETRLYVPKILALIKSYEDESLPKA